MTRSEWHAKIETISLGEILDLTANLSEDDIISETLYANSEICNGGFFQYYSNSIFDAKKHISDLRAMELEELANIVQQSLDFFPNSDQPRRTDSDINPISDVVLELIGSKECFENLEEKYYRNCDAIEPASIQYFRTHADEYWSLLGEDL